MKSTADLVLSQILHEPDSVAIVGTGAQADEMRTFLRQRFRLRTDDIPGASSTAAPTGKALYLLCATPPDEAFATLQRRGVARERITPWSGLKQFWLEQPRSIWLSESGTRCLGTDGKPAAPPDVHRETAELLERCHDLLESVYRRDTAWTADDLLFLGTYSRAYLAFRRQWSVLHQQRARDKRLLFPSAGRSGGTSLTRALQRHPRLVLRVDHEGRALLIYRMLAHHRRGELEGVVLGALLGIMLDEFDCLGGNPLCFLVPYVCHVPWFECHVLKVERPHADLHESITLRNFHYTEADFISNRITAAAWGDATQAEWESWDTGRRVDWYIRTVDAQIERATASCARVVRTPLDDIERGSNDALTGLGWPSLKDFPHVNTLPKDRVYTLDERIALYLQQRAAPGADSPGIDVRTALHP
jgi:hypothetical protein